MKKKIQVELLESFLFRLLKRDACNKALRHSNHSAQKWYRTQLQFDIKSNSSIAIDSKSGTSTRVLGNPNSNAHL